MPDSIDKQEEIIRIGPFLLSADVGKKFKQICSKRNIKQKDQIEKYIINDNE